jgi:hypothetical protein
MQRQQHAQHHRIRVHGQTRRVAGSVSRSTGETRSAHAACSASSTHSTDRTCADRAQQERHAQHQQESPTTPCSARPAHALLAPCAGDPDSRIHAPCSHSLHSSSRHQSSATSAVEMQRQPVRSASTRICLTVSQVHGGAESGGQSSSETSVCGPGGHVQTVTDVTHSKQPGTSSARKTTVRKRRRLQRQLNAIEQRCRRHHRPALQLMAAAEHANPFPQNNSEWPRSRVYENTCSQLRGTARPETQAPAARQQRQQQSQQNSSIYEASVWWSGPSRKPPSHNPHITPAQPAAHMIKRSQRHRIIAPQGPC